jgi:hypothetical protein
MGAVQKFDVSVNIAQDFSDAQKAQGRANIGATRVVLIDTTATNAQILKIVAAGETPEFFAIIGNNVVTYTCSYDTWTRTEKPYRNEWVSFTPDTLQTTMAKKIFAIGDIEFGYYFDNNASFRLAMRSTSGTHSVCLDDSRGFGRDYSVTTDWKLIQLHGFSNSYQLGHFKGYDTTGNVNLDFDVYFANSMSTIVAQYRINL